MADLKTKAVSKSPKCSVHFFFDDLRVLFTFIARYSVRAEKKLYVIIKVLFFIIFGNKNGWALM